MPKFTKFYPRDLLASLNRQVKEMARRLWTPPPVDEKRERQNGLFLDANRGVTFNGISFYKSAEYLAIAEPEKVNLEDIFKTFVIKNLFPTLTVEQAEAEYVRLVKAYNQKILTEAFLVIFSSTCQQNNDDDNKNGLTNISQLTKQNNFDIRYKKGKFKVVTTITSLRYDQINRPDNQPDLKIEIPGTVRSTHHMESKDDHFTLHNFAVTNSFLESVLFRKNITFNDTLDTLLNSKELIGNLTLELENYKKHLRESIYLKVKKEDPMLYSILKSSTYDYDHYDAGANPLKVAEINFDQLLDSENVQKHLKQHSRSTRLAVEKYKVLSAIQTKMNSRELGVDKANAFVQGVCDNMSLFKTNRDSYFGTFIKHVTNILTLGFASRLLFATQGEVFINNSFAFFFSKTSKQPELAPAAAPIPERNAPNV